MLMVSTSYQNSYRPYMKFTSVFILGLAASIAVPQSQSNNDPWAGIKNWGNQMKRTFAQLGDNFKKTIDPFNPLKKLSDRNKALEQSNRKARQTARNSRVSTRNGRRRNPGLPQGCTDANDCREAANLAQRVQTAAWDVSASKSNAFRKCFWNALTVKNFGFVQAKSLDKDLDALVRSRSRVVLANPTTASDSVGDYGYNLGRKKYDDQKFLIHEILLRKSYDQGH